MKIQSLIDSGEIIEIDYEPESECSHQGVCIKDSDEVSILVNYNEGENELDGYAFFRGKHIVRFRPVSASYLKEQLETFKNKLDISLIHDFKTGLDQARKFGLLAITTKDDLESYYVGKLVDSSEEVIVLHLVDENSKWSEELEIELDDILFFSFNTKYGITLAETLEKSKEK